MFMHQWSTPNFQIQTEARSLYPCSFEKDTNITKIKEGQIGIDSIKVILALFFHPPKDQICHWNQNNRETLCKQIVDQQIRREVSSKIQRKQSLWRILMLIFLSSDRQILRNAKVQKHNPWFKKIKSTNSRRLDYSGKVNLGMCILLSNLLSIQT
jgi:hypothetical protein